MRLFGGTHGSLMGFDNCPDDAPPVMPRYCGRCGERLEQVRQSRGYSTATGVAQFAYWFACPKAPHKDRPYRPYQAWSVRLVTCDGTGWADSPAFHLWGPDFIDCTPWPEPTALPTPTTPDPGA